MNNMEMGLEKTSINDWKFEMDRMLGVFEGQAIESLRYINQSFELSGRPFNEEFRKYFLQISNDRLSTAYSMVEMEKWVKNQVESTRSHRETFDRNSMYNSNPSNHSVDFSHLDTNNLVKTENGIETWLIDDPESPEPSTSNKRNSVNGTMSFPPTWQCLVSRNSTPNALNQAQKRKNSDIIEMSKQQICSKPKKAKLTDNKEGRGQSGATSTNKVECMNNTDAFVEICLSDDEIDTTGPVNSPQLREAEIEVGAHSSHVNAEKARQGDQINGAPAINAKMDEMDDDIPWVPIQLDDDIEVNDSKKRTPSERRSTRAKPKSQTTIQPESTGNKPVKEPFKCGHCKYTSFTKRSFYKHLLKHPNGLFACQLCIRKFTSKDQLEQHVEVHKNRCLKCKQKFATSNQCDVHENHCKARRYECFACEYGCKDSSRLRQHMLIHTGDRPFQCEVCSKKFSMKRSAVDHMKRVHNQVN